MLILASAAQLAGSVHCKRLLHCTRPEGGIWFSIDSDNRVDGRAGKEENLVRLSVRLGLLEIHNDVALIEATGSGDHRWRDAIDWTNKRFFGRDPFASVRTNKWCSISNRGRLAEVDAVEPGEEIDDLAPDAACLDADTGVVSVNDGRTA